MRYFSGIPDDKTQIWNRLAGEMINLECGKYFYDNGKWIHRENGQITPFYPETSNDTGKHVIRIKTTYGIIYLPDVDSMSACNGIITK